MTQKLSGAPASNPSTPTDRKWISAEAAKEASKRALDRLKDRIVDSLRVKLESPVLQNGESGNSVDIFKQALSDPTVTNVRLAQTILRKQYPTVAVDGQLGPKTLSAMDGFITVLAERARKSTDLTPLGSWEPEGSIVTPGASNGIDPLVRISPQPDSKIAPPKLQQPLKQDPKPEVAVRAPIARGSAVLINEDSLN
jgi:peptidoglycan hydrolase-like protein with peptidoglycan-binding domain